MGLIALVCRSGGEYMPEHANWLLRQIPARHTAFVMTDHPARLFRAPVLPLQTDLPGWWAKIELFRPGLPDTPILYIDLDTVIRDIPDDIFVEDNSLMLQDFYRPKESESGMMLIQPRHRRAVWEAFWQNPDAARRMRGDGAFISQHLPHERFQDRFPDKIASFKANISAEHGGKNFRGGRNVDDYSIICFHGNPRPWDVAKQFDWIPDEWI